MDKARIGQKYDVIPRYTGGSPGYVDESTALRILSQETEEFEAYQQGFYGDEGVLKAQREKLEGIVIRADNKQRYTDLITGREYGEVPYAAIRYPDVLWFKPKGHTLTYFYRRVCLGTFPTANSYAVLRALKDVFEIDPTSEEAYDLLRKSKQL